jgi:hypothetical protein
VRNGWNGWLHEKENQDGRERRVVSSSSQEKEPEIIDLDDGIDE